MNAPDEAKPEPRDPESGTPPRADVTPAGEPASLADTAAAAGEHGAFEPAATAAGPASPGEGAAAPASPPPHPEPVAAEPRQAPTASRPAVARPSPFAEPAEVAVQVPRRRLRAQTRRDFLLFTAGVAAAAAGAWWLLPDRTRARLLPHPWDERLDTLAARGGLSPERRERLLDRGLTFDDDVAEALYSKRRRVRTYSRSEVTPLRNNYDGRTPGPEILPGWRLELSGLASGATERLPIEAMLARFTRVEQVTRLVCVEGWSAIAWWGGIRFGDLLAAFPPAPGMRWAALRSAVNLDGEGRPDPYYVSIDLDTARHPQTLLATHYDGRPLSLAHGAPLRLLAPMKLGLKNIKAVTHIAYTAGEPADYWNERGYSRYDGL